MESQDLAIAETPVRSRLGHRATAAGAWSILEFGGSQALRLVSNLIMTRLLLPDAFGVMAMVSALHLGLTLFSDIGIATSIIRSNRGGEAHFLRVAWVVQILRGLVLAGAVVLAGGLLWLLGPHVAPAGTAYADPLLPPLIIVSSVIVVLEGAVSTNYWLAARNMQLGRLTGANLFAQASTLVAMVLFARLHDSAWAILAGLVVGSAMKMALSHVVIRGPRMGLAWDMDIVGELWHFGKWLLGSSALTFVAQNADRLIMGALLNTASFGFYIIALMWVQAAALVGQKLTAQIVFPVLSEVQRSQPDQVGRVFRRASLIIDAILLAGFLVCLFGGQMIVGLLYTDTYATAGHYMSALSLMILAARFRPMESLLLTYGHSRAMMSISALKGVAICIGIPLGYSMGGVTGALLATALAPMAGAPLVLWRAAPFLGGVSRIDLAWLAGILVAAVPIGMRISGS